MTTNNTKKRLVASLLSLAVCFTMLVGSTFAWFTDTASTSVNTIIAGTLDVSLVNSDGNSVEGETLSFMQAGENTLWEPGVTWELEPVYVVNNGNLNVKYKVEVTGVSGDEKLNEVIEWVINIPEKDSKLAPGEKSEAIKISAHMKESAGNEYMGLKLENVAITVQATQDTVEHDSIDNQYDKNAVYADEIIGRAIRINGTDIEVYMTPGIFTEDNVPLDKFTVKTKDGTELELNTAYGYVKGKGYVYFEDAALLTIQLKKAVEGETELILDFDGEEYKVPYDAYYKYSKVGNSGVTIKGSRNLMWPEKTVDRAVEMVDTMLEKQPEIAARMAKTGCCLVIFGPGEHAYYIPEHRTSYDSAFRYVEGFGGTTCSITEANIWHWLKDGEIPDPDYYTLYWDENILVHEFGHGVKISGIDMLDDQSLAEEFQMIYRHAVVAGLWPNTYAISNSDEYFATMSAIWFNVMNEATGDDNWSDGVRCPINTRKEMYNYDRDAFNYFAKIYNAVGMGENWESCKDSYKDTTIPTEEIPAVIDDNITFNYPKSSGGASGEFPFGVAVKINYNGSHNIDMYQAATNTLCLWWDYVGGVYNAANEAGILYVTKANDNAPAGSYNVYISNNPTSEYITVVGDKLMTTDNGTIFTLTPTGDGTYTIAADGVSWYVDGSAGDGTLVIASSEQASPFKFVALSEGAKSVLFIHDAKANGGDDGVLVASGDTVELTANVPAGKTFVKWEVKGKGSVADETSATTTFTSTGGDAVVWARYE